MWYYNQPDQTIRAKDSALCLDSVTNLLTLYLVDCSMLQANGMKSSSLQINTTIYIYYSNQFNAKWITVITMKPWAKSMSVVILFFACKSHMAPSLWCFFRAGIPRWRANSLWAGARNVHAILQFFSAPQVTPLTVCTGSSLKVIWQSLVSTVCLYVNPPSTYVPLLLPRLLTASDLHCADADY